MLVLRLVLQDMLEHFGCGDCITLSARRPLTLLVLLLNDFSSAAAFADDVEI